LKKNQVLDADAIIRLLIIFVACMTAGSCCQKKKPQ